MSIKQEEGKLQYECEHCHTKIETENLVWNCPTCNSSFKNYLLNCNYCKRSVLQNDVEICYVCNKKICKDCIVYEMCPDHLQDLPVETIEKIKKYHKNYKIYNILSSICAILIIFSMGFCVVSMSFNQYGFENIYFWIMMLIAIVGIGMGFFIIMIIIRDLSWKKLERIIEQLQS